VSTVDALQKKYARSIFEMEFLEDAGQFVESLKKIPGWRTAVTAVNGTPVITVRAIDIERARKELPPPHRGKQIEQMTRYEMNAASIEDIFRGNYYRREKK